MQPRSGIEVEQDAPEAEHRVDRDEQQEQGLDREDHRVRDVREHLFVVAETTDRLHHEMVRDHVDSEKDQEPEAGERRDPPLAGGSRRTGRASPGGLTSTDGGHLSGFRRCGSR